MAFLCIILRSTVSSESFAEIDTSGETRSILLGGEDAVVSKSAVDEDCGIWLAPSAIPGAGLGMFAGKDFLEGQWLQEVGDLMIPIIDIRYHQQGEEFSFLWDEYNWDTQGFGANLEGFHDIPATSPGFGSAANSFLPLVNVDMNQRLPYLDFVGLHRSKDPGVGAFSPYYDRGALSVRHISAGEEFYVSYGKNWFRSRKYLGPIPLDEDLNRATHLFQSFRDLHKTVSKAMPKSVLDEFWDSFIGNSPFPNSRVFGGFRHGDSKEKMDLWSGKSLTDIRIQGAIRSPEWLRQHGTCGDHLTAGESTLPQAGHGAFASRNLPQGTIVAQIPLIHVTNRSRFNMYYFSEYGPKWPSLDAGPRPPQLLLNYCFGHGDSTLLLCPYGPIVNYINHNQTQANVRIRWADPARGNFMPHLLNRSLVELETDPTAKLAFELVATRNIQRLDEIFLDYGDEWEQAWQKHVETWTPVEGAGDYKSVHEINKALDNRDDWIFDDTFPFSFRIPPNVQLTCHDYFSQDAWRQRYESGEFDRAFDEAAAKYWPCHIISAEFNDQMGEAVYTVQVEKGMINDSEVWTNVPSRAFRFQLKPYSSDIFLPNAFRHDLRIPDELFPNAWRNLSPIYVEKNHAE